MIDRELGYILYYITNDMDDFEVYGVYSTAGQVEELSEDFKNSDFVLSHYYELLPMDMILRIIIKMSRFGSPEIVTNDDKPEPPLKFPRKSWRVYAN